MADQDRNRTDPREPADADRPVGRLTVANVLSGMRLVGSPILVYLAFHHETTAFAWLLGFLFVTDWIDGKLAVILKQRTTFGARLDTCADVMMYAALIIGLGRLKWELIQQEAVWLIGAVASYALSVTVSLIRFRRIPSYHTRAAKSCWLLAAVAVVSVLADWSVWPLRITAIAVLLTNLEAVLITFVLPEWKADVPSVYHALRNVDREE